MVGVDDKERVQKEHEAATVFQSSGPELLLGRILDRCLRAILAITPDRSLLYQNAAARILTKRQDLLEVRDGRLRFVDRGVLTRVDNHITGDVPVCRRRSTESGALALRTYARVASDKPRSHYRVLVTPLDSCGAKTERGAVWLVFVSELGAERSINVEVLTQLYGLTPAESCLAVSLFSGHSLEEAARVQDISINTAKTHLRQVFQKCGVQSQANLLQLLALGPRAF
jgi:DNA-binding CsgD family transcriptional regulator